MEYIEKCKKVKCPDCNSPLYFYFLRNATEMYCTNPRCINIKYTFITYHHTNSDFPTIISKVEKLKNEDFTFKEIQKNE